MLGGAIGIAVINSVWNSYVRSHLPKVLPADQVDRLLSSIASIALLPPGSQTAARETFARGYNAQMRATTVFAAAQFLVAVLMFRRKGRQVRLGPQGTVEE